MKRIILLLFMLTALVAAPVAASQTESEAIDAVAIQWYQTTDPVIEADLELALVEMELEATSPECSRYAGWHLAMVAIYRQWVITESPYLEETFSSMFQSTTQVQYACTIAA